MTRLIPKYKAPIKLSQLPPAKLPLFRNIVNHPTPAFSTDKQAPGPIQHIYTTSPRPLIPLTTSPTNHILWNPPRELGGGRIMEKDESGRLASFKKRFGMERANEEEGEKEDLSWLDGETVQSSGGKLGKKDIVGNPKSAKKGKK